MTCQEVLRRHRSGLRVVTSDDATIHHLSEDITFGVAALDVQTVSNIIFQDTINDFSEVRSVTEYSDDDSVVSEIIGFVCRARDSFPEIGIRPPLPD